MEIKNERVLAFTKAKILEPYELDEVSGGAVNWSSVMTGGGSAGSGQGGEVHVDTRWDW